ncbi:BAF_collapsed_G0009480.mRNA.1.CDS.1 [Saccharomyces cerevisiae]|nr:CFA_G0009260.mRNA.1.CDS.1 [Saccharomyces cerevisiae]CAI5246730.1 BAF_HP2_G0009030.mRNA.1.CDS.1 [Saccharomyces cerevisiae]CAI6427185.1 BAF_HP1_G0009490.mRNA.1.CDS.1 [Saccharomyces cerevisiae]CAI6430262.1 BAF_HP2_G0009030.mRNA.1.CDS.1 [Saccharomyces cerevisiae]CAI7070828.1 BAF_collapsed_G0009480.mRNA.1.CDS.1 [Saccharomyces cerevisiae]
MAQNFGKIPSHKSYVLSLYRTVLRNIPKCCHSYAFQYEIKKTLSKQLFKHKHDKSSWSVYTLLNEFSSLNNCLLEGKLQEIKNLMKPLKKMKKQLETTKILNSLTSLGDVKTNDPEEVRRFHVLSAYIKRKQDLGLLPAYIPKTYQHKLLLPLALNEHACLKLFHIQQKLKNGPPSAGLSYTKEGRNQIWFVRSPINKGRQQSKKLGILIRKERKDSQKNIDNLNFCEINAAWALHEAIWEEYLESKKIIKVNLPKYLEYAANIPKSTKCNPSSQYQKIKEWVDPVREIMFELHSKSFQRVEYFNKYKEKLLKNGGQLAYFDKKSKEMYAKRLTLFRKMSKETLPYVTLFIEGRDLPSVLAKYGF